MNYFMEALKKYAVFNGRANRAEYWYFVLFYIIIAVVLSIIDAVLKTKGTLTYLLSLALLLPNLGLTVRRLHDIGKSGPWIFVSLIPAIGSIWLLILLATQGNPGDNAYGSPSKPLMATPKPPTTA
ncbi:MAG: DUF805 domain-containing protein [Patescibacteria group bacterium]|jgi:uncharacterized membrane protein YhaH (DUF805 family)